MYIWTKIVLYNFFSLNYLNHRQTSCNVMFSMMATTMADVAWRR